MLVQANPHLLLCLVRAPGGCGIALDAELLVDKACGVPRVRSIDLGTGSGRSQRSRPCSSVTCLALPAWFIPNPQLFNSLA